MTLELALFGDPVRPARARHSTGLLPCFNPFAIAACDSVIASGASARSEDTTTVIGLRSAGNPSPADLPQTEQFPPTEADDPPNHQVQQADHEAHAPPVLQRHIALREKHRGRRRAVIRQPRAQIRETREAEHHEAQRRAFGRQQRQKRPVSPANAPIRKIVRVVEDRAPPASAAGQGRECAPTDSQNLRHVLLIQRLAQSQQAAVPDEDVPRRPPPITWLHCNTPVSSSEIAPHSAATVMSIPVARTHPPRTRPQTPPAGSSPGSTSGPFSPARPARTPLLPGPDHLRRVQLHHYPRHQRQRHQPRHNPRRQPPRPRHFVSNVPAI